MVRTALFIQNSAVLLCAVCLCVLLLHHDSIQGRWNGWMTILGQMVIIAIAIVARLASTASRIAIEKDWIVVVAEGKRGKLASKWNVGIVVLRFSINLSIILSYDFRLIAYSNKRSIIFDHVSCSHGQSSYSKWALFTVKTMHKRKRLL